MTAKEKAIIAIVRFTQKTLERYNETNYAEDRVAFQRDIVTCANWFVEAYNSVNVEEVITKILDSSSAKYILDYYKQGKWGDEQAKAFVHLQDEVKQIALE